MRRYLWTLALAACCLAPALDAHAQTGVQVHVVDVDPPVGTALGRNEPLSVRIEFNTDRPVNLWAHPYFEGKEVAGARTNASPRHSGTGYALGWFSFDGPADVDEVRILAGCCKPWREWEVARYPVQAFWTGQAEGRHATAAWVAELKRADRAAERHAMQAEISKPITAGETALFAGLMLLVLALLLGSLVAPVWAVWKWRGGWRVAASVPFALMMFVVLRIVAGVTLDSTSHNLWPFEILMAGAASLVILGTLAVGRRLEGVERG